MVTNRDYRVAAGQVIFIDIGRITHGGFAYDWTARTIYKSKVYDWGGIEATDDVHLVSINVDDHSSLELMDGNALASQFSLGDHFRAGALSTLPSTGEVAFSVIARQSDVFLNNVGDPVYDETAVFAVHPNTGSIRTLFYSLEDTQVTQVDEPFLSPYSAELDALSLTAWGGGYLKLLSLSSSDVTTTLEGARRDDPIFNEAIKPYDVTLVSDIDAVNGRIFLAGYYPEAGDAWNYDSSSLEISVVNIQNAQKTVVATRNGSNGIPLQSFQFEYNEALDLLVDVYTNQLVFIDPVSGDRVLLPLVE